MSCRLRSDAEGGGREWAADEFAKSPMGVHVCVRICVRAYVYVCVRMCARALWLRVYVCLCLCLCLCLCVNGGTLGASQRCRTDALLPSVCSRRSLSSCTSATQMHRREPWISSGVYSCSSLCCVKRRSGSKGSVVSWKKKKREKHLEPLLPPPLKKIIQT